MKTRREIIQEILDKIYGSRIQAIFFDNDDVPYIPYWYDEMTDSFMTEYVLVPIAHNTEDINFDVIYDYIDELEGKLMEHFKNKYDIELLSCETDD